MDEREFVEVTKECIASIRKVCENSDNNSKHNRNTLIIIALTFLITVFMICASFIFTVFQMYNYDDYPTSDITNINTNTNE